MVSRAGVRGLATKNAVFRDCEAAVSGTGDGGRIRGFGGSEEVNRSRVVARSDGEVVTALLTTTEN